MAQQATVLRIIRWGAWALIALLTAAAIYVLTRSEPPKVAIGGPFTLTAMDGARVSLPDAEKGKPFAVFFGFTHCPDICPTAMYEMGQLLKAGGSATDDFRVYFVSVDPERDTPEQLRLYLSAFDSRLIGMTGTTDEIAGVARQHRAFYRKVPTPSGYTMDHTATIYLFDRKGSFWGTLDSNEAEAPRLAKLQRLLK